MSQMFESSRTVEVWFSSLVGSMIVGLVGFLPRFIVPNEQSQTNKPYLELLLSVAVGSQLADVFVHLLSESYSRETSSSVEIGRWILFGLVIFFLIEQIFPDEDEPIDSQSKTSKIKTTGYLNLLANIIDNFTHGAAIGGGFVINRFVGLTTLIGIIIHEIPHEIGDFAILLKSGFDREQASRAQIFTSLGGVVGASMALLYSTTFDSTVWVLPFTSGGFLYVALVKTINDLLKKNRTSDLIRSLSGMVVGLTTIVSVVKYFG